MEIEFNFYLLPLSDLLSPNNIFQPIIYCLKFKVTTNPRVKTFIDSLLIYQRTIQVINC